MKIASLKILLISLFPILFLSNCKQETPKETPLMVKENPVGIVERAKEVRENTAIQLADGLKVSLWASDSLAPDPIAMSVDDFGNVYLTRTNRQKNSEFDIRGHRNWITPSIALQSVVERRAFLREYFAPEKSEENSWVKDLNNDGSHDWKDLAIEQEEIWKITDETGDGIADVSTRILSDFNEEITDVAGALLVRREDVFVGVGPDMWRLKDTNDDGVLDEKTSISHGFAVHIGFSGHGMSGAIEGPDGKIYWGIGDIGANITAPDGTHHKYPNQGVLVRSNPDGSDFEVFAAGLRNTHEFVFDEYGNIISSDNDGDHPGESERLVHIVEGSDAGWRANWQYGKYTDPKNNDYKVWMDEEFFKPRWEGQAAHIIPPIVNYHNGPTGMVYNPGTALGSKWKNHFFLVEFVGNPSRSPIWGFTLKPKGASFDLNNETQVMKGVLPTGIKFGPDGALYIADWINGWDTKNYGRVWRLDVADEANDLAKERKQTQELMQLDYADQNEAKLYELLFYSDMRIRQKAQLELASRGSEGDTAFKKAIEQKENQLTRIHGIWGIGQLSRKDLKYAQSIVPLLNDSDPEIIAQTAKILGDVKFPEAADALIPLVNHENDRVKFFSTQALGRLGYEKAIESIIGMLETNNDEDLYLRHAGVLALTRIGKIEPVLALSTNENRALRIAGVLVLRRLQNEKIAVFLKDKEEYIVTEAARGINDDWSIEPALPALAALLAEERFSTEPLLRRAINAALRVGGEKELDLLVSFAQRKNVSPVLRAEALAALGTWAEPSVTDRVDGRYRGVIKRDDLLVRAKVGENIERFLKEKDDEILVATAGMLKNLNIPVHNEKLVQLYTSSRSPKVKSALLPVLFELNYDQMESLIKKGMADANGEVRTAALGLLDQLEITNEGLAEVTNSVIKKGSIKEQQSLLKVLGKMPVDQTQSVFEQLINDLSSKKLSQNLALDLSEAVEATESEALIAKIKAIAPEEGNTVAAFQEALFGGDARVGRRYFFRNSTGQCVRCHVVKGQGGEVGPELTNIGNILSREQLLEALIEPSARLSPGFGMVTLTLDDGQTVSGILMEENEEELILRTSAAEPLEVAISRIKERQNLPSSMPPMGTIMSKREIRDMVEFLSNLKG